MKIVIQIFLFSFLSIIILMSFGNGPALRNHDKTGSPLSDGKCFDCHSAGKYGVSLDIKMYDKDSVVSEYVPGHSYKFKYRVKHVGNPAKYGFQTVFLDSTNTSVGKFDSILSGFQITTLNNVDYVEHSSARPLEFMNFYWKAPEESVGDITIYFGGIAANGNGGNSGDGGAVTSLVITPKNTSANRSVLIADELFTIKTNPVNNFLILDYQDNSIESKGRIFSNTGQIISSFGIDPNQTEISINAGDFKPGLYIVQIVSGNKYLSKKFIKI